MPGWESAWENCCVVLCGSVGFSDFSLSAVYLDQLFLCWVIVYSDQLLGARHTLLYLITIFRCRNSVLQIVAHWDPLLRFWLYMQNFKKLLFHWLPTASQIISKTLRSFFILLPSGGLYFSYTMYFYDNFLYGNNTLLLFFSPCRSIFGVNHLIVFETNRIIVSLIPFHFPLPVNQSCFAAPTYIQAPRLAAAFRFIVESCSGCQRSIVAVTTAEKDGKAEIQTLDPWSGKLLCWLLDHATPL